VISREQIIVLGILWVAGWGISFLFNPARVCRIIRWKQTAKRSRIIRMVGAVSLVLALVSAFLEFRFT
jgi:hypothetical protein